MKKIKFNRNGFSNIVGELEEIGLLRHDETLHGIKGISRLPRWCGTWDGTCWTEFSMYLTAKGLRILENSTISDYKIINN